MYDLLEVICVSTSATIRALLALTGMKQQDLLKILSMSSVQSLSNKVRGGRWSAVDLCRIAEATGCKVAFILPDGQQLVIEEKGE